MKQAKKTLQIIAAAFGTGIVLCFVLPVKILLLIAVVFYIAALFIDK